MEKIQIEKERERLMEFYGKCILVVQDDGSVKVVGPDGQEHDWELDDSMRYRGYFRDILAKDIFKEVIIKE